MSLLDIIKKIFGFKSETQPISEPKTGDEFTDPVTGERYLVYNPTPEERASNERMESILFGSLELRVGKLHEELQKLSDDQRQAIMAQLQNTYSTQLPPDLLINPNTLTNFIRNNHNANNPGNPIDQFLDRVQPGLDDTHPFKNRNSHHFTTLSEADRANLAGGDFLSVFGQYLTGAATQSGIPKEKAAEAVNKIINNFRNNKMTFGGR